MAKSAARTCLTILVAVALSCGATATANPPLGKPVPADYFGINGVSYLHYRDSADATSTAERRLGVMKDMGARWDRTDMWWGLVEPRRGEWHFTYTDWQMDFFRRNGMQVVLILNYTAKWMEPNSPLTDDDRAAYAEYARQMVGRYRDTATCWEIWNEPNIPTFWKPQPSEDAYLKLLKAAYPAIKEANPKAVAIGAVTSMTDLVFINDIASSGALDYMDAICIHPYSLADGPDEMDLRRQLRNTRAVLARHGKPDMPLWITEMGRRADIAKPREVDEQSRFIVQAHVTCIAEGVERVIWFCVQDWVENGELVGYGVMSPPPDNKVKRSAGAYGHMVSRLTGARYAGCEVRHGVQLHAFEASEGGAFAVAWAPRHTTATLALPGEVSAVHDVYGNEIAMASGGIEAGDMPLYITLGGLDALPNRAASPPAPRQLLVNGGFDMPARGALPYGWQKGAFNSGMEKGECSAAHDSGTTDGRLVIRDAEDLAVMSYPVPALPGEQYRITARGRGIGSAAGEAAVQLFYYGNSGWRAIPGPKAIVKPGGDGWQPLEAAGTVPADADVVRVAVTGRSLRGAAEFESIELVRTAEAPWRKSEPEAR